MLWSIAFGVVLVTPFWPWLRDALANWKDTLTGIRRTAADVAELVLDPLLATALLLISAAWLAGDTYNPFIYYRF